MSLLGHAKRSVAGSVVVEGPRAEEPPRAPAPAFRHPVAFARALLRTRPRRPWALSRLAWSGTDGTPAFWVDPEILRARVQTLAGATDIQPRGGDLRLEGGQVVVVPPVEGRGLDVDAAIALIVAAVGPDGATTLALPVAERIQPRVNAAVLADAQARAGRL